MKISGAWGLIAWLVIAAAGRAEVRVNLATLGGQLEPAVAMDQAGNFVVVWWGMSLGGQSSSINGRLFDAEGNPRGGEFKISEVDDRDHALPCVSMGPAGNFVVGWVSLKGEFDVRARIYNSQGEALTGEFQVCAPRPFVRYCRVAMNDAGDFVFAWQRWVDPVSQKMILMGRAYHSDGSAYGDEFVISDQPDTLTTALSLSNEGKAVVLWTYDADRGTQGLSGLFMQFVDVQGRLIGTATQLAPSSETDFNPSAGHDGMGKIAAVWTQGDRIVMRRFGADGAPLADIVTLHENSTWKLELSKMALADDGRFLVTFGELFARWFDAEGSPLGPLMRIHIESSNARADAPVVAVSGDGEHAVACWTSYTYDGPYNPFSPGPRVDADIYMELGPHFKNSAAGWHLLE